ncbi:MAG: hypothetical protein FWF80_08040 [Defluviitaleaceae bacterium]|nr:hypothetical protein [Defluviitaleaceae bacterium]
MTYQINRMHLLICILAGTVISGGFVWFIFFDLPRTLFHMAFWVSLAIVVFYFIGCFVRGYLLANVFLEDKGYNFEEDEEYQAFVANLEGRMLDPADLMTEEPIEFVDPLEGEEFDDAFSETLIVTEEAS